MKKEFSLEFNRQSEECGRIVRSYLPKGGGIQDSVVKAMEYALMAGGKRIRPLLMLESYLLFHKDAEREHFIRPILEAAMAGMEMIHTFSLCHDDLPCMDNDKYRRGRESVWYHFGEANGVLCGDALSLYAFEIVSEEFKKQSVKFPKRAVKTDNKRSDDNDDFQASYEHPLRYEKDSNNSVCGIRSIYATDVHTSYMYASDVIEAIRLLSSASGINGMLGGQVVDVEMTGKALSDKELEWIYKKKTGCLIMSSMEIGAVLAGAETKYREILSGAGERVGMAFQIQDDILGEVGDENVLGKPIHSDAENGKTTYVSLHGIEHSKLEAERLLRESQNMLMTIPADRIEEEHRDFLLKLFNFMVYREK